MTAILTMDRITVQRLNATDEPPIVDSISLSLAPGEILGLIGESGAGKSTIALCALGYTRSGCAIAAGQILIDGQPIDWRNPEDQRHLRRQIVSYVAQSAALSFNPSLSLGFQITEMAMRHGQLSEAAAQARAEDLLRQLDIEAPAQFLQRYPHEVSGGQLQRAMAAMAMMTEPRVIVFDEPTTALDVTTQVEVLLAFRKLVRASRTAALYISHDLAVVSQLADRIMVLRHGKMVEVGPTQDILANATADYTRQLLAACQVKVGPKAEITRMPLLEVAALSAGYGQAAPILSDISLKVGRGETFAVVGESGCGKSTLARTIAGLIEPSAGHVAFDGVILRPKISNRTRDLARRLQFVFQSPDTALNPRHTVFETLARPLQFYFNLPAADLRYQVFELLAQMGLKPELANRLPGQLSGGQKQRLCLARALAAKPDLLICDEITSALDPLVAEEILVLLADLSTRLGMAYLFITHDLNLVRRIADKVAVIKKGRIIAQGTLDQALVPGIDPYIDALLASVPRLDPGWLDQVGSRHGPVDKGTIQAQ
jgi:peptide/nickel transport system ATP-binding protein